MSSDGKSRGKGSRYARAARRACAGVGALLLVTGVAVGGGSASAASLNVTGTWVSVFTYACAGQPACPRPVPGTFTLKQAAGSSAVSGTYKSVLSVSGTLAARTLTLDAGEGTPRLTVTIAADGGSWSGAGTYPSSADRSGVGTDTAIRVGGGSTVTGCVVPNVEGDTLAAADSAITTADCEIGGVKQGKSEHVKTGHVISQKPAAGSAGPKVSLDVSKGPGPTAPPGTSGGGSAPSGVAHAYAGPTSQSGEPRPDGSEAPYVSLYADSSATDWTVNWLMTCTVEGGPPQVRDYAESTPQFSSPITASRFHDALGVPEAAGDTINVTIDGTFASSEAHGTFTATYVSPNGVVSCQPANVTWNAYLCNASDTRCGPYVPTFDALTPRRTVLWSRPARQPR